MNTIKLILNISLYISSIYLILYLTFELIQFILNKQFKNFTTIIKTFLVTFALFLISILLEYFSQGNLLVELKKYFIFLVFAILVAISPVLFISIFLLTDKKKSIVTIIFFIITIIIFILLI